MTIPTEPIGSIPRPLRLIEAVAATGRHGPGAGPALRRGDPGHHRAVRGHRLAGHHRRRAAEVPQLLDLLRPRAAEHRPRRLQDPVLGRPRPPDAAADGRPVPLQAARGQLPGRGPAVRPRAGQAGGHLALGPEPHVPARRDPRLPPRAVHRRPAARARDRGPQLPAEGRAQGPDRLHGGAAGGQDRPLRGPPAQLHRPEQPRAVAVLRRGPPAHRRPHLPRRRPRLDPQRGRRLRRAAAQPVRAEGRELLRRPGGRDGPRPRPEDHPRPHEAGPAGLRRRRRADRPARRDAGGGPGPRPRGGRVHPGRAAGHDATTAGSRRSATTPRRPATRRSRRSGRACSAPRSRRKSSEAADGGRRTTRRNGCAPSPCRTPRASSSRASAPRRRCGSSRSGCGSRSPASATR